MRLQSPNYRAHIWPRLGAAAAFTFVVAVLVYDHSGTVGRVVAELLHF